MNQMLRNRKHSVNPLRDQAVQGENHLKAGHALFHCVYLVRVWELSTNPLRSDGTSPAGTLLESAAQPRSGTYSLLEREVSTT